MGKRVLIYALIYGAIGASLGAFVAFYTATPIVSKNVVLKNGSATKDGKLTSSRTPTTDTAVAEPTNIKGE